MLLSKLNVESFSLGFPLVFSGIFLLSPDCFGIESYYPASNINLSAPNCTNTFPTSLCYQLDSATIGDSTYWIWQEVDSDFIVANAIKVVAYQNPNDPNDPQKYYVYRSCEIVNSLQELIINQFAFPPGFGDITCNYGSLFVPFDQGGTVLHTTPPPGFSSLILNFNPATPGVPGPSPTVAPSPTPSTSPSPQFDLSASDITLFQPIGVEAPLDSSENSILATIPPPTADPAPKVTAVRAEVQLKVNMTGTPSGATSTNVQLKLGSRVIADQPIDIRQFHPGENIVKIDFVPPTDRSLLGILPLTATVNASKSVQETNFGNGSATMGINTMVLCKVEDAGRAVPFHAQTELPWAPQTYGIPTLSSGTFKQYGCSVTDLYMLFSSYGITNTPIGSPADPILDALHMAGLNGESLDPGTLNSAMANYTTNFFANGSVGFDAYNNPIWFGAAEVARAGYQAQCLFTGSCDPVNAPNVVSFKGLHYGEYTEPEAIAAVQNEICSGNPVIMKFKKNTPKGQHFMLATGIVLDSQNQNKQTLRLNNPGSTQTGFSKDALYSNLRNAYPPSSDMYSITRHRIHR
jgi:hypothetical protein